MSHLIVACIQAYRWLVPSEVRRVCLFRESCSAYVYRVAIERGACAAILALLKRSRQCAPGYSPLVTAAGISIVCRDGTVLPAHAVNSARLRASTSECRKIAR